MHWNRFLWALWDDVVWGSRSNETEIYICLIVCFATKAVHSELTVDLSTEVFLRVLHRFIARRGRCSKILSDCGTNFVAADKYLIEIRKNVAESERIRCSFNPPSAPYFGGLWEAGVKSVKRETINTERSLAYLFVLSYE